MFENLPVTKTTINYKLYKNTGRAKSTKAGVYSKDIILETGPGNIDASLRLRVSDVTSVKGRSTYWKLLEDIKFHHHHSTL